MMEHLLLALAAYTVAGALFTGLFDWDEATFTVAVAPVVIVLLPVAAALELGRWLRDKTHTR